MVEFSYELRDLDNEGLELILVGYLDEQTVLPEVEKIAKGHKLVINFGRVSAILSMGVKTWVHFSAALEQIPHLKIEFKNCSKPVMDQINLVKGFLPSNGTVTSLFVPIYCGKCSRNFKVLKKVETIKTEISHVIEKMDVPDCEQFPSCRSEFELECNPISYLKFLDR